MLQANGLQKHYGSKVVLQDASFHINDSEFVSIMGPSGEGKSTITRILCGTVKPDAGTVSFDGQPLVDETRYYPCMRRSIQLIPQQPFAALDPRQTIGSAIMEPLLFHKLAPSRAAAKQKALELLERMLLEPNLFDRRPDELSGGQAQRALIARSLTVQPKLLIADEATSMLDISSQAEIVQLFQNLIDTEHISVLLISHNRPLVESVSQRIYHLQKGQMMEI